MIPVMTSKMALKCEELLKREARGKIIKHRVPMFRRTHVAPVKTIMRDGQSDPYVVLSFTGAIKIVTTW